MDDVTDSKKDNQVDMTSQEGEHSNLKQDEGTPSHHDTQSLPRQEYATDSKYRKLKHRFDALKLVSVQCFKLFYGLAGYMLPGI